MGKSLLNALLAVSGKKPALFILLSILFGIIRTLVSYNGFGYEDQVEQLPLIYRSFESSYLQHDFFVNAALESAVRTNYIRFIRLFTNSPENLPLLFFIFTVILNAAISLVTFLTARALFLPQPATLCRDSFHSDLFRTNLKALIASALVMLVPTFHLGASPNIFVTYLIPSSLAAPFIMLAVFLSIRKRIAWAMLAGGAASLVHPLFGLETMALVLFAWIVAELMYKEQIQEERSQKNRLRPLAVKLIISALLLTVFALLSILPQLNQHFQLNTREFIHIIGHFRHPHHYIPGSFPATHYLLFLLFLLAFSYAWHDLGKTTNKYNSFFVLILNLSILAACISGYLFVEIIPLRLAAMAQTFRLLYLFKWTGLIFLAGFMVQYFTKTPERKGYRKMTGAAVLLIIVALFARGRFSPGSAGQTGNKTLLSHEIVSIPGEQAAEIAEFAKQNTPADAVFLTPHNFGFFRLSAERAIVADFKCFPFTDQTMLEWYKRIRNCYGSPQPLNRSGFENEPLMINNYTFLNDKRLKELQEQYNFTHAVLFAETTTTWDILFSNAEYTIIRMR